MQGFDPAVAKLMSAAVAEAVRLRAEAIAPLHLFLAVLGSPTERVEQALARAERRDIDGTAIFIGLLQGPDAALEDALTAAGLSIAAALGHVPKAAAPPAAPGTPAGRPPTPLLDELGRDLTALARAGKL